MRAVSIDPGDVLSAYTVFEVPSLRPLEVGKIPNAELIAKIADWAIGDPLGDEPIRLYAIEMIQGMGMPAGKTVFETCVWIGRFEQQIYTYGGPAAQVFKAYRKTIATHHTGSSKAKDGNVAAALQDRFASGVPNRGKGTKAEPGWFHGFAADIWQAYAVGVYWADTEGMTSAA